VVGPGVLATREGRDLAAVALGYLCADPAMQERACQLAADLYEQAADTDSPMTVKMMCLNALNNVDCEQRDHCLAKLLEDGRRDPLVLNKYIMLISSSSLPGTLDAIRELQRDGSFDFTNPNQVYAKIGGLGSTTHVLTAEGARFIGDLVLELDPTNPQVASRVTTVLSSWRKFVPGQGRLHRGQLERILATEGLSDDVFEIASKSV